MTDTGPTEIDFPVSSETVRAEREKLDLVANLDESGWWTFCPCKWTEQPCKGGKAIELNAAGGEHLSSPPESEPDRSEP